MPFSFPSSPSVGQQSQQNGRTYSWSGYAWELVAASGGGGLVTAASVSAFPATGSASNLYITTEDQRIWRWDATASIYVESGPIGGGFALASVPASATSTGSTGQIAADGAYWYYCSAPNTWVRTALATWVNFAPTDIAGLQAWYDASDASTLYDATTGGSLVAADGAVARWQDKSGNARHMTQATSGSRPLRKTSQQNGKDTLLFDGTNDFFEGSDFSDADSGGMTVFLVYKRNATGAAHELLTKGNTSGVGYFIRHAASDTLRFDIDRGSNNAMFRQTSAAVSAASYAVVGLVAVSGEYQSSLFYKNGSAVGMAAASVTGSGAQQPPSTTGIVRVGAQEYQGTYYFHANANIAEIIIYNSALSNTDRAAVEAYLISKWGIT